MALEGTHIRFAIDSKSLFEIENLDKYVAGSVYPDSRYPTGIDRVLTHDDSQMAKVFWKHDDFRKGWAAHLLYDKIQYAVHSDWFKNNLKECNQEMSGEDDWIFRTALKILQDINDVREFDIKEHLRFLRHVETPNGENEADVKKYNQLLINLYQNAPVVTIEILEKMWVDWGIDPEISAKIRNQAYTIRSDDKLMTMVSNIYDETLKRKQEFYNQYCL